MRSTERNSNAGVNPRTTLFLHDILGGSNQRDFPRLLLRLHVDLKQIQGMCEAGSAGRRGSSEPPSCHFFLPWPCLWHRICHLRKAFSGANPLIGVLTCVGRTHLFFTRLITFPISAQSIRINRRCSWGVRVWNNNPRRVRVQICKLSCCCWAWLWGPVLAACVKMLSGTEQRRLQGR